MLQAFTSYVLNMFRILIYPSSRDCDYSVELPHWSIVLGSMCVGVLVWYNKHIIQGVLKLKKIIPAPKG